MVFSQNAYVLNDSSSEHKISQKYDSDSDVLHSYVDGIEKIGPRMIPNYDAGFLIYNLLYGSLNIPTGTLISIYTVPENGYISVYDCANNRDYYLFMNLKEINTSSPNPPATPYHKCGTTNAANGFFPVNKGDVINIFFISNNTLQNGNGRTNIYFIPGKIIDN